MPLAEASIRGAVLNWRLAVNGIHQASRSSVLRRMAFTGGPFGYWGRVHAAGVHRKHRRLQRLGKPAPAFNRAQESAMERAGRRAGPAITGRAALQRFSAAAASAQQAATASARTA